MTYLSYILITGIGATAVMDLWGIARKRFFGQPAPNYDFVGRWIAGFARGQFTHESIAASPAVRGERVIGWSAHYLTGIVFAAMLIAIVGLTWVCEPTIGPALVVGIGTVAAPFLVMQPAMGAGIAASRTANPAAARLQSLLTHAVFGLGLYGAAHIARLLCTAPHSQ
jgi:hypothetical protein